MNSMKAIFYLKVLENKLYVKGQIPYINGDKQPQIIVGKNVNIHSISINGNSNFVSNVSTENDYFIVYTNNEYEEEGVIEIEYDTNIVGENNIISDELIAISLYSNPFPIKLETYIDGSLCYLEEGFENYDVMNSYIDEETGLFVKETCSKTETANIIAYKKGKYKSFEYGKFKVFYRTESAYDTFYKIACLGDAALKFFNQIYQEKNDDMEIYELGLGYPAAYNRGNIVVYGADPNEFKFPIQVPEDFPLVENDFKEYLIQAIVHEIGHKWFIGADIFSYEDWLNETGAEWSNLLYLLAEDNKELFDKIIKYHEYQNKMCNEPIKPSDNHKPNAVHSSGVILFYKIYQKYGKDMIIKMLKLLSEMELKTTDKFIELIRTDINSDIADFMLEEICRVV